MTHDSTGADLEAVPTTWKICALPLEHPRWHDAAVTVFHALRMGGYLVYARGYDLNRSGRWEIETRAGDRDEAWYADHTFACEAEAFAAAKRAAVELARQVK